MTLLGITGMQTTILEEKMAGNSRNQMAAFQAAETGLRGAEQYLEAIVTSSDFDDTNPGLLSESTAEPDYLNSSTWVAASSVEYNSGLPMIQSEPRYTIKLVEQLADSANAGLNIGGYGENLAGNETTIFKVSSRGTGGTDNARVTLQSYYGKRF